MQHFAFDSLESTSTEVSRLISAGESLPFVVSAAQQTAGRGRLGSEWSSDPGNLYFSIGLDVANRSSDELASWPLRFGAMLAHWLREQTGIWIRIKWPNDLLFAGRKLGGILCETQVKGHNPATMIVGVGINVLASPTGKLNLPAISIHEATGNEFAPADLLNSFLNWFHENHERFFSDDLNNLLPPYLIGAGHELTSPEMSAVIRGVDEAGSLQITTSDGQVEGLLSVRNQWNWVFDANHRDNQTVYIADVGNTRTKLYRRKLADDNWEFIVDPESEQIPEFVESGSTVYGSSVNPEHQVALEKRLDKHGCRFQLCPRSPVRLETQYHLKNIGMDRLAALEGALARGARSTLVLSAGTALTIDGIDADGRHGGGWIVPGLSLYGASLHQGTGRLPLVGQQGFRDRGFGQDTEAAIANGYAQALHGWLEQGAKNLELDRVSLLITGGDAELLEQILIESKYVESIEVDWFLIPKGILEMLLGGFR